jgi:hypothetical protein
MRKQLPECIELTGVGRFVLSHRKVPGELNYRPCSADGCTFGHDPETVEAEAAAMLAKEAELAADKTKDGRVRFSRWRMTHAVCHSNIQPGKYGEPMFEHDLEDQILDALHLAQLGVPKTPWKHGVLNNASDDAREAISEQLAEWRHPLDTKRKDAGRQRVQKWFTGEKWATFCSGERGSPGGPIAIATLVLIIADDMQARGVTRGSGTAESDPDAAMHVATVVAKPKAKSSKTVFAARNALAAAAASEPVRAAETVPLLQHVPTAMELAADPEDIAIIRQLFGSRAQTIINTLLAFDAYFNWYYPLKESIPLFAPIPIREARAFENMNTAIDMMEMFERISIRNHKSFLVHGAIFKVTRDILHVGDIWSFSLSALELQNAETKRVASSSAAKNLTLRQGGDARIRPLPPGVQGPAQRVHTKGFPTTMAISLIKNLLVTQKLRSGDGLSTIATMPASRRTHRLMDDGRTKQRRTAVKLENLTGPGYTPRTDSCLKAFVRLLAARASQEESSQ